MKYIYSILLISVSIIITYYFLIFQNNIDENLKEDSINFIESYVKDNTKLNKKYPRIDYILDKKDSKYFKQFYNEDSKKYIKFDITKNEENIYVVDIIHITKHLLTLYYKKDFLNRLEIIDSRGLHNEYQSGIFTYLVNSGCIDKNITDIDLTKEFSNNNFLSRFNDDVNKEIDDYLNGFFISNINLGEPKLYRELLAFLPKFTITNRSSSSINTADVLIFINYYDEYDNLIQKDTILNSYNKIAPKTEKVINSYYPSFIPYEAYRYTTDFEKKISDYTKQDIRKNTALYPKNLCK